MKNLYMPKYCNFRNVNPALWSSRLLSLPYREAGALRNLIAGGAQLTRNMHVMQQTAWQEEKNFCLLLTDAKQGKI